MCYEEIDTQDEGEVMSRVLGRIVFEENAMHRAVRQSWNPSQLDKKHRLEIADVLTEIADHLRNDEFEVNGEYKKFPAKWTQE